jgi:hypothetical protein
MPRPDEPLGEKKSRIWKTYASMVMLPRHGNDRIPTGAILDGDACSVRRSHEYETLLFPLGALLTGRKIVDVRYLCDSFPQDLK